MSTEKELLEIAEGMADVLRLWQKLRQQAEEAGRESLELKVPELFEAKDADALRRWEEFKASRDGRVSLFEEVGA